MRNRIRLATIALSNWLKGAYEKSAIGFVAYISVNTHVSSHFRETLYNLKNLLIILAIFTSCVTKSKKQIDTIQQNGTEKKYTKIISDSTNKLTGKIEKIDADYLVFGCACPNWIRTKDNLNTDTTKKFKDLYFYIEPADSALELPIYFDAFRHSVQLQGQFYQKEDYPKGTIEMEEPMPKAKVFRYTKIEVINKPTFKPDTKIETLTLNYNAISCTCAQWSQTHLSNTDKKKHYWLEPANDKLIDADAIFNGVDLPVQIKVTGQVVTENGFPKRNLSNVEQEEAGKVFKYTRIEILQNGQKKNGY
ncbi:MAG: hypothetical protein JWP69_89 [Flaviaesturariibacter sp.]|nr:hypothetical protein [Flaviaesturariibacter sp.]